MPTLTDAESAILSIERRWWRFEGTKEDHVRSVLGISMTRYYQVLNRLIDSEAAIAADPITCRRLRGRRDRARAA